MKWIKALNNRRARPRITRCWPRDQIPISQIGEGLLCLRFRRTTFHFHLVRTNPLCKFTSLFPSHTHTQHTRLSLAQSDLESSIKLGCSTTMDASSGDETPLPSTNVKALFSFYTNYLQNSLRNLFPVSIAPADSFLSRIMSFHGSSKRRRRKTSLPLPLPSATAAASLDRSSAYEFSSTESSFFCSFVSRIIGEVKIDCLNYSRSRNSLCASFVSWHVARKGGAGNNAIFYLRTCYLDVCCWNCGRKCHILSNNYVI